VASPFIARYTLQKFVDYLTDPNAARFFWSPSPNSIIASGRLENFSISQRDYSLPPQTFINPRMDHLSQRLAPLVIFMRSQHHLLQNILTISRFDQSDLITLVGPVVQAVTAI
jgi:hypothetical protein